MSDKIRLHVPVDVPEGFPEFVEQGYLSTKLPIGEVIEVEDRRFADWLVRELGLEEVGSDSGSGSEDPATARAAAADFPEDFPRREIFTGQELSIEDLRGKSREELIALPGVGEKTADAILEYFKDTPSANAGGSDTNGGDE